MYFQVPGITQLAKVGIALIGEKKGRKNNSKKKAAVLAYTSKYMVPVYRNKTSKCTAVAVDTALRQKSVLKKKKLS